MYFCLYLLAFSCTRLSSDGQVDVKSTLPLDGTCPGSIPFSEWSVVLIVNADNVV